VHNLKAEQEGKNRTACVHAHTQTREMAFPGAGLLFLRVPHAQDKQIFVLEIVARDGIAIREHFVIVEEDQPSRGQRAARRRGDAVA